MYWRYKETDEFEAKDDEMVSVDWSGIFSFFLDITYDVLSINKYFINQLSI